MILMLEDWQRTGDLRRMYLDNKVIGGLAEIISQEDLRRIYLDNIDVGGLAEDWISTFS